MSKVRKWERDTDLLMLVVCSLFGHYNIEFNAAIKIIIGRYFYYNEKDSDKRIFSHYADCSLKPTISSGQWVRSIERIETAYEEILKQHEFSFHAIRNFGRRYLEAWELRRMEK